MSRKFALVFNKESGVATEEGPDKLRARLEDAFEEHDITLDIHPVTGDELVETLETLRDQGAAEGCEALIIAGGDGSVAAAAKVFLGSDMPVGVVPLGTMNLAARDFGIPLEIEDAAETLAEANPAKIDVLMLGDKVIICNMILGFYPAQALMQPEYHGRIWILKIWQTLSDTLRAFTRYRPLKVTIQTDDGETTHYTRFLSVTSNRYEELFGLLPRHETLDQGFLTVYISHHKNFWGLLHSSLAFVFGRLDVTQDLLTFETRHLKIESNRSHLPVMLDGEVIPSEPPLEPELRGQALNVLLPRRETAGQDS